MKHVTDLKLLGKESEYVLLKVWKYVLVEIGRKNRRKHGQKDRWMGRRREGREGGNKMCN